MAEETFIEQNKAMLADYVRMSRTAGDRSDYVQGGGGNTSVKLDDRLMAVKASGYRLDQVDNADAYAVLDYQAVREFYLGSEPADFADVEQSGSAKAKASVQQIDALPQLRPSVEAGFHSLLDRFVLHTHPVYANLAACCREGQDVAQTALAGLAESHAFIPYINPGAQLTFSIRDEMRTVEKETGRSPAILIMQNHGLIITGEDADGCLKLHDEVNALLAKAFETSEGDWPTPVVVSAGKADRWRSATPWLALRLKGGEVKIEDLVTNALYPDQLVFLGGQVGFDSDQSLENALVSTSELPDKCTVFTQTGEVYYQCSENEANTIEQTLCAILFIRETIAKAGKTLCTMDQAGSDFIKNWESEKYRKGIASK